jgi:hypothetical protein
MKTLTPVLGLGFFLVSSIAVPFGAQAKPLFSSSGQTEPSESLTDKQSLSDTSTSMPKKMAAYRDCVNANANVSGADFKQVNKFCACVADQSIQGSSSGNLTECATTASGGDGGGAMGIIGEVAPSVITGVMEGLSNRSSKNDGGFFGGGGGGLLGGLGDLLGSGGGFSISDLLKNRL